MVSRKDFGTFLPHTGREGPPPMAATRLRVYHGPDGQPTPDTAEKRANAADMVTLPAEEIVPLLADAYLSRRTWLRDFEEDAVTISADLYEVLVAYRFFNRPSA
jgi:hypothetical protein